jgi:predicted DNA-binding transcriptional regulator YafY
MADRDFCFSGHPRPFCDKKFQVFAIHFRAGAMMDRIPKYERLLNLISYLLKSPEPIRWADIRGRAVGYDDDADETSLKRRFERDKDELRAMGIPVDFARSEECPDGGYTINRAASLLPPIEITAGEALTLSVIASAIEGAASGIYAEARSALLKLVASAPAQVDAIQPSAEDMVISLGLPSTKRLEKVRDELASALAKRKAVSFQYRSLGREAPHRAAVEPYGLAVWAGRWYLVGRCRERGEVRVWNVERIASGVKIPAAKNAKHDYKIPKDFDVRRHVGIDEWQIPDDARPVEARVIFHPDIAWMIEESVAGGAASAEEKFAWRKDGWGELRLSARGPQALVNWALKFGEKARIVSPPSLVKLAAETLRGAIIMYKA